jgi:Na+/phosphate symporter
VIENPTPQSPEPLNLDPPLPPAGAGVVSAAPAAPGVLARVRWDKIGLFVVSLFLFVMAINLMKEGARGLAPLVRNVFDVSSPANALGFGWLFAYLVMSGSPVAASALAFFDAGVISQIETFAMITGSRFGASFIVLFIGFIYVLRGRDRSQGLSMGLLSLLVTFTTYTVALFIGVFALRTGALAWFQPQTGALLSSIFDLVFDPVIQFLTSFLPGWALFFVGLGIILVSFNLFDRCLPEMSIRESQVGRISQVVYRPWVMFLLGSGVTMISMSVSVSLSILVPLSHRGFVRRENVIPYIMGANITTFVDTLLAAVLLGNPEAFTVVLVEMVAVATVSAIILIFFYQRYQRWMLDAVIWVTNRNRNLAVFMFTIFAVPIVLLLL